MWVYFGLIVVLGIGGYATVRIFPGILRQAKENRELENEFLEQVVSVLDIELKKLLPGVPLKRCDPHLALDIGEECGEGVEMEIHVDRDIIVFFGTGHQHFPLPVNWPGSEFEVKGAACPEISAVLSYAAECFSSNG